MNLAPYEIREADVDLAVESIDSPACFPLVSKQRLRTPAKQQQKNGKRTRV